MIARKQADIRRPRDFHAAIAYIAEGEKVVKRYHSSNLASIKAAPYQMAAVAACNFAVRSVGYHFSLTLPSGVRMANDELLLIGKGAVRTLGFSDSHQWFAAIHDDTDYQHIHFVINRIDPKTKYAHALHYDYQKLQKFRRNLAAEKGWERDARSAAAETHFPYDSRACDQESRTLQTSFQRYLGDYCAPHLLQVINHPQASWQSFHQALTGIGIAYIPRPRGAAIVDIAGSETAAKRGPGKALAAKASHLGFDFCLPNLIAKFGPYEAPLAHYEILPDRTYGFNLERGLLIRPIAKHPKIAPFFKEHQDLLGLWEANRMVPAANHLEIEKEIRHHTAAYAAVRTAAQEALEGPSLVRRSVLKKVAHELLKIAEKHMRALVAQVKKKLRKGRKPPVFRNWLKSMAKKGDAGAIEALRILHLPSLEKSSVITAGENAPTKQGSHSVQSVDAIIIAEPVVQVPHFIIEIPSGSGDDEDLHMNAETTALHKARERARQRYLLKLAEEVPDEFQPEVALYAEYLGGSPSPADQWAQQILSECEREAEIRQNRRRRIEQAGPDARDRIVAEIDANVLSIQARQKLRNKSVRERKALLESQSQERIPSFAEFLDVGMDGALDRPIPEFAQRYYLDGEDIVAKLPRAGDSCENIRYEISDEGKVIYQFGDGQVVDAGTSIEVFGMSQKMRNFALLLANEKAGSAFTLKAEDNIAFDVLCDAVNLDLKVSNYEYQHDYHDLVAARVGDGVGARVEKVREDYSRLFNTPAWSKPDKHRQAIQEMIEKVMIDRIKSQYGNVKKGLRGTLSGKFVDISSLMGRGCGVFDSSHGVRLVDLSPEQAEWARENLGRRLRLSNETGNAKDLKMTLEENARLQVRTDLRSL